MIDNKNPELAQAIDNYWSKRAASYSQVNQEELQGRQHQAWQQLIASTIAKAYPQSELKDLKVLDIGTGPGFLSIILAELGCQVTALDANYNMLEQARLNAGELAKKTNFIQGYAQRLPFAAEQFEVVISRNLTWVLPQPQLAYQNWCRVLKSQGLLINFDANWYNYLYDPSKKAAFEQDRRNVAQQQYEDHYLTTDMVTMERIALQVPLSPLVRPAWDIQMLTAYGMKRIEINSAINDQVLSEVEKLNYASTPYFMITAVKP